LAEARAESDQLSASATGLGSRCRHLCCCRRRSGPVCGPLVHASPWCDARRIGSRKSAHTGKFRGRASRACEPECESGLRLQRRWCRGWTRYPGSCKSGYGSRQSWQCGWFGRTVCKARVLPVGESRLATAIPLSCNVRPDWSFLPERQFGLPFFYTSYFFNCLYSGWHWQRPLVASVRVDCAPFSPIHCQA
jgi:hypothetical protein